MIRNRYSYVSKVPEHLRGAASISAKHHWDNGLNTLEISELLRVSEAEIYNLLHKVREYDRVLRKRAENV
jgi:hypothetical protein